jgi:polysaccharide biosynthesis PFTS motif protein
MRDIQTIKKPFLEPIYDKHFKDSSLPYHMGIMKGEDGSSLGYDADRKVLHYTLLISKAISETDIYKELMKRLPSKRVIAFINVIIRDQLQPIVYQASAIQWYKRQGAEITKDESVVFCQEPAMVHLLERFWDFENISIRIKESPKSQLKTRLKKVVEKFLRASGRYFSKYRDFLYKIKNEKDSSQGDTVAVLYCYGVGADRNDIPWYANRGISPDEVLICLEHLEPDMGEVIRQIEERGFRWVVIVNDINSFMKKVKNCWFPPILPGKLFLEDLEGGVVEKWLNDLFNSLIADVYLWMSFIREFKVRVFYLCTEADSDQFSKAIAFDVMETRGTTEGWSGIVIGRQRSEIFSNFIDYLGMPPVHLYFIWNRRSYNYFNVSHSAIDCYIISGFTFDLPEKQTVHNIFADTLRKNGARFIVSFYDNAFHLPNFLLSYDDIRRIYTTLLAWVIEDSSVGLLIKPKKTWMLNQIHEIQPLLKEALNTGRLINIKSDRNQIHAFGISHGVDMSIGCLISSPLIESVIYGGRGIMLDVSKLKTHEFYDWGYESIIFDDLERMMTKLKMYKDNREDEPSLGDWTPYLDELDPFEDRKGGYKQGFYMKYIFDALSDGKTRDEAISHANILYGRKWGSDKVFDVRKPSRTVAETPPSNA